MRDEAARHAERQSDLPLAVTPLDVQLPEEVRHLAPCARCHRLLGVTLAVPWHVCILQTCKMLSTRQESYRAVKITQEWPWSAAARLHNLTRVQEPDIGDLDREEYHARLGVVLQQARKTAKVNQKDAARAIGMNPASFTRWEAGATGISAYDLARLVQLYRLDLDADLVLDPPASKVEIKRRLEVVAQAAQRGVRRGLLHPLDEDPEDDGEPG